MLISAPLFATMSPSRGRSVLARQLRTFATAADPPLPSASAKRARAQAHLANVDTRNGTAVSSVLVDSFGRGHDYLRISLTERCNLRCTYCMPEEGVPLGPPEHLLTNDEIVRVARLFAQHGVNKIRLTGGEPTLRKDLVQLIERLSAFGTLDSIGMTSNGIALSRKLPDLVRAGLTGVNLSLDTLDPFKFEFMTRRRGHSAVMKALDVALEHLPPAGVPALMGHHLRHVKLNVVVIRGVNDGEVAAFAELARQRPVDIRFIEYMPFDDNAWATRKLVPSADLLATLRESTPDLDRRRGHLSDTSRSYSAAGWLGTVGFISSMSDHFCAGCSRLRLGADGGLKVCLFGPPKISLRPLLRAGASDAELLDVIGTAVRGKKFAHDGSASTSSSGGSTWPPHGAYRARTGLGPLLYAIPSVGHGRPQARLYSTKSGEATLTHIDAASGRPKMVDVGDKLVTRRTATAVGSVYLNVAAYEILQRAESTRKGDALTIAQLAGTMAAKNASALIPLCHPVILDRIDVRLEVDPDVTQRRVRIEATVACEGKTGVEMEALVAVNAAALTLWDMLKAVAGKEMRIGDIYVSRKSGGRSGDWERHEV